MNSRIVLICTICEEVIETLNSQRENRLPDSLIEGLGRLRKVHFEKPGRRAGTTEKQYKTWEAVNGILKDEMGDSYEACKAQLERFIVRALALNVAIPSVEDFTFYLDKSEVGDDIRNIIGEARQGSNRQAGEGEQSWSINLTQHQAEGEPEGADTSSLTMQVSRRPEELSYDSDLWLWSPVDEKAVKGRALICLCQKGSQWSVTYRKKKEYPSGDQTANYLNKIGDINGLLSQAVFGSGASEMRGVIVISGRTGSSKSQIAHALINTYLHPTKRLKFGSRTPHLLTFEDPIEKPFDIDEVDYTPRERGRDVADLREAVSNALRQTPAVMFVGEIRAPEEWELLFGFAGTGHLAVTTTHAGSLTEAMSNILHAVKADDSAARSLVGERLLALIHLRPEKIKVGEKLEVGILIPAVWRRTPEGIKALMAEGLSSLVPNTPKELDKGAGQEPRLPSSIGRYWFARELLKTATGFDSLEEAEKPAALGTVIRMACEWDLQGV